MVASATTTTTTAAGRTCCDFAVTPFIEPSEVNNSQLLFLTIVYALILYQSSNLIASGSELLLLIPAVAGLVGSIVLPILGAVPDGVMTLFSGIGDDAQNQVSLGVGVLAGSTVMLLTFPWFIAVWCGRVPLKNGKPDYTRKDAGGGLFDSGIGFNPEVQNNARIMLMTTLIYLVIQVPAYYFETQNNIPVKEKTNVTQIEEAKEEHWWSVIGLVLSIGGFCGYLFYCYKQANNDKVLDRVIEGIKNNEISLGAAIQFTSEGTPGTQGLNEPLAEKQMEKQMDMLKKVAKPFFVRYDKDKDHKLSETEFKFLLEDLGEVSSLKAHQELAAQKFATADENNSGQLEFDEFVKCLSSYLTDSSGRQKIAEKVAEERKLGTMKTMPSYGIKTDDDEEEAEEMPEDIAKMPEAEQRKRIIFRASWMMLLGTFVVLFVSDPFVDVLNVWGKRLNIPAFYVSFVVAPFASNASELLSAYTYAVKKTKSALTTSISTLIGAACMNNTFVLAIFFGLIFVKNLAWEFTAETISIMVVQWLIGILALKKEVHSLFIGCVIFACYPLCLAIVAGLEKMGLD